jgi:hypothetical protein
MINKTEYEKICMLIKKGDLSKLQEFVDLAYEKGDKIYLLEARDALITYLSYYPQSFITYFHDPKSRENPLVQAVFGIERPNKIVISDNVSGGFILNNDELLDGSKIQESYMFKKHGFSLSSVDNKKNRSIGILLNHFSQIDKKKLRLIDDNSIEITKKQVSICGKDAAHPHYFERTRYNAFKLLGDDAKIYISSPRSTPLLYGESSKGRGLVLGLRK